MSDETTPARDDDAPLTEEEILREGPLDDREELREGEGLPAGDDDAPAAA